MKLIAGDTKLIDLPVGKAEIDLASAEVAYSAGAGLLAAVAASAVALAFTGTAAREAWAGVAALVTMLAWAAWQARLLLARRAAGSPGDKADGS
jgi:hypothetical protein